MGTQGAGRIPDPLRSDPPRLLRSALHDVHFNLRDLVRRPNPTTGAGHPDGRNRCGGSEKKGLGGRRDGRMRRRSPGERGDWEQKPQPWSLQFLPPLSTLFSPSALAFATAAMSPLPPPSRASYSEGPPQPPRTAATCPLRPCASRRPLRCCDASTVSLVRQHLPNDLWLQCSKRKKRSMATRSPPCNVSREIKNIPLLLRVFGQKH